MLDGEGIAWIEEPVRADDFRGSAEVAAQLATPIQKNGGVTGWLRAAALAQAAGVPCSSHIFIEVSAHLLAVTPTCHFIEYLDVAAPILAEPLRPVDGALQAPRRPGIGLAWDEDAARRYHVA